LVFLQVSPSPELVDACGASPSWACRRIFDATGNKALAGFVDFLFGPPLRILTILVVAFVASHLVRRAIRRFTNTISGTVGSPPTGKLRAPAALRPPEGSARAAARAQTIGSVLRSLSTAVIYGIAGITILGELGINLGPIVASAGIAGVALGFGAQSLVKDFLSGIFMLVEDQYGVGDIIDVGEASGVVEAVGLRTTRLRDVNGTVWYVPNGQITRVGNKSQEWARAVLDVTVSYDGMCARPRRPSRKWPTRCGATSTGARSCSRSRRSGGSRTSVRMASTFARSSRRSRLSSSR
jgi:small conductance mechanosensitive channel